MADIYRRFHHKTTSFRTSSGDSCSSEAMLMKSINLLLGARALSRHSRFSTRQKALKNLLSLPLNCCVWDY